MSWSSLKNPIRPNKLRFLVSRVWACRTENNTHTHTLSITSQAMWVQPFANMCGANTQLHAHNCWLCPHFWDVLVWSLRCVLRGIDQETVADPLRTLREGFITLLLLQKHRGEEVEEWEEQQNLYPLRFHGSVVPVRNAAESGSPYFSKVLWKPVNLNVSEVWKEKQAEGGSGVLPFGCSSASQLIKWNVCSKRGCLLPATECFTHLLFISIAPLSPVTLIGFSGAVRLRRRRHADTAGGFQQLVQRKRCRNLWS